MVNGTVAMTTSVGRSGGHIRKNLHGVISSKSSVTTSITTIGPADSSVKTGHSWSTIELPLDKLGVHGRKREVQELKQAVFRMMSEETITSTRGVDDICQAKSEEQQKQQQQAHTIDGTETKVEEESTMPHDNVDKSKKFVSSAIQNNQRELILVSGYSGTGKTALVSSTIGDEVLNKYNNAEHTTGGTFAIGKFDQSLGDDQSEQQQQTQQPQQKPFAAFGMICQELAQQIAALKIDSSSPNHSYLSAFEQLKDTIMMELGTELIDLIQVFPSLDIILSTMSDHALHNNELINSSERYSYGDDQHSKKSQEQYVACSSSYGSVTPESRHRFTYAFRTFIRIISSFLSPMVFVLDDLQWADAASLDLLEGLISDQSIKQLMIVGIYRSNEVDETHILSKTLQDIRTTAPDNNVRITEMEIGNLDVIAVQEILDSLLSIDEGKHGQRQDEVNQLAKICHRKTNGNAFYLIHFLSMLHGDGLLSYNNESLEWGWNMTGIEQATKATQNVVEILQHEMSNLSSNDQRLIQFAAYLGSAFDDRPIYMLWKDFQAANENNDKDKIRRGFKEGMRSCVKAGFLEYFPQQRMYRWVHDKLQEAAMNLTPAENHRTFSRHIAEVLHSTLTGKELDTSLFIVMNRYNEGTSPRDVSKRLTLAKLNLRAANKAVSFSAFESVSTYCRHGIRMLPEDCWEKHYQLSLDLYSLGAEAGGFLGKVHRMERYCNKVLLHTQKKKEGKKVDATATSSSSLSTTCGVRDRFRVYSVMMDSISNRGNPKESVDLCLDVLRQYGAKFPKGTADTMVRLVYNLGKIKSSAKLRTEEEAHALSRMDDPARVEQMGMFDKLTTYLYLVGDKTLMPLVIFKSFQWTISYGLCQHSPPCFALVSFLLVAALRDVNVAAVYARYALILLSKLDPSEAKQVEARTTFLIYSTVLHWTQPLDRMLKPLLHGYEVGMKSGDTESATFCIANVIWTSLVLGKNLSSLEDDCRVYTAQMKQSKKDIVTLTHCTITRQYALNLMGRSQFTTRLTGVSVKEDVCREHCEKDGLMTAIFEMYKLLLYSIFGDYENGAKLALKVGTNLEKVSPGPAYLCYETFHRCLCLLVTARKLKKEESSRAGKRILGSGTSRRLLVGCWGMESKCIKSAKQGLSKIKGWIEQGNPNVVHHESLIEAEFAMYQGQIQMAKKHYETAITMASQGGFIHDCALANERYGEYYLELAASYKQRRQRQRQQQVSRSSQKRMGTKSTSSKTTDGNGGITGSTMMHHNDDEYMQESRFRIQESIDLYREWGAHAKADILEEKYSTLLFISHVPHTIK